MHVADWYPTFCRLAGVDGSDDPPVLPLEPSASSPDIYQGNLSWPRVDGVDVWDQVLGLNVTEPHPLLWLSAEVLIKDGRYKVLVAQPSPETMSANSLNNGWKGKNNSWYNPPAGEWSCDKYKDRSNFKPCLFDLVIDPSERENLAEKMPKLMQELWAELNRTELTAYVSRSPADLIGTCNAACTKKLWAGAPGPICGVPGCKEEPSITV